MKKIVLTGGGTAGHVIPHIALIPKLEDAGYKVYYIGSYNGIERDLISDKTNIEYHGISSGKLRRYFSLENFSDQFKILKGLSQARKILKKIKPDVLFSKGGFVSVPVVVAASMLKIPVVIHESDITSGLANKLSLPFCTTMCTTFEDAAKKAGDKGVHTGSPVRMSIMKGKPADGRKICGFDKEKPIVLIMGGSLGAMALNECIDSSIDELTQKYQIIHLRGAKNINSELTDVKGYKQFEYVKEELPHLLKAADVIVSRAGANAIFEFAAINKPMLLIPLPLAASRGDQILNAKYFEEKGYARVLDQEDLNKERLLEEIDYLLEHKTEFEKNMKASGMSSGLNKLFDEIIKVSK